MYVLSFLIFFLLFLSVIGKVEFWWKRRNVFLYVNLTLLKGIDGDGKLIFKQLRSGISSERIRRC